VGGQTLTFDQLKAFEQPAGAVSGLNGILGTDIGAGRTMVLDFTCRKFELHPRHEPFNEGEDSQH
jgi:hypothetical protein